MNCHSVLNCVGHNHKLSDNRLIKETVLNYVNEAEFKELFTIAALEKIETVTSSAITATSSAVKASLAARNAVNDLTAQTLDFVSDAINGFNDDIGEVIKSLGFITIDSFEIGATLTQRNQALRHTADGKLYRWAGDLPKNVPEGSTPASTGGMGVSAWLEVSDTTIRQQLSGNGGVRLVGNAAAEVDNLVALRALVGVRDTVNVLQHTTGTNLGGGTYRFEVGSSKQDNNGTWVRADDNSGTWVLISRLYFETFGVTNDGTDQSTKIQTCIDFALDNKVRDVHIESDTGSYGIASTIVFKPSLISEIVGYTNGYAKHAITIHTNSVIFKPLAEIEIFVVLRDSIKFKGLLYASGEGANSRATLFRLGALETDILTYPKDTYTHSAMFFELDSVHADTLYAVFDIHSGYAVYYTRIGRIAAREVGFAVRFNDSEVMRGDQITRTQIDTIVHAGGACTIYGESFESVNINSIFSEFINQTWHKNASALPDGKPVAIYLKKETRDNMKNHSLYVDMALLEGCTRMINSQADQISINGYYQTWENQASAGGKKAFIGDFTSGVGVATTPNAIKTLNVSTKYQSFVTKPVSITSTEATSEVVATLPNPEAGEFYGGVMYLPTTNGYNNGRVELAFSDYPRTGWWYRTSKSDGSDASTWTSLDRPHTTSYKPVADKADINKMRGGALESVTYSCSIDSTAPNADSPSGGEFFGIIKWEGLGALTRGIQVAEGYYPRISKKRYYIDNAFTAWADLHPTAPVTP